MSDISCSKTDTNRIHVANDVDTQRPSLDCVAEARSDVDSRSLVSPSGLVPSRFYDQHMSYPTPGNCSEESAQKMGVKVTRVLFISAAHWGAEEMDKTVLTLLRAIHICHFLFMHIEARIQFSTCVWGASWIRTSMEVRICENMELSSGRGSLWVPLGKTAQSSPTKSNLSRKIIWRDEQKKRSREIYRKKSRNGNASDLLFPLGFPEVMALRSWPVLAGRRHRDSADGRFWSTLSMPLPGCPQRHLQWCKFPSKVDPTKHLPGEWYNRFLSFHRPILAMEWITNVETFPFNNTTHYQHYNEYNRTTCHLIPIVPSLPFHLNLSTTLTAFRYLLACTFE